MTPATSSSGKDTREDTMYRAFTMRRLFLKLLALAGSALACHAPGLRTSNQMPSPAATPTVTPTIPPQATSTTHPTPELPPTATPILPKPLFIVDGHQDITWNWLEFGRDPRQSALEGRQQEDGGLVEAAMGDRTTGLPEYLAGRVGIIFSSLFMMPAQRAYRNFKSQIFADSEEAYARGIEQIEAYHRLAAEEPRFSLITDLEGLDTVLASWQTDDTQAHKVGLVIMMEGAASIRQPAEVHEWYDRGLRSIILAWQATQYAGASGDAEGLTDLGRELLAEMAGLNMIVDLSHLSRNACLEALDTYPGPIVASHSNPITFVNTDRGISNEVIRKVGERDGVVGIMLFNRFLNSEWTFETPPGLVTIRTVVDAIDAVVQLTGSTAHVAIGSDFDGGFGAEAIPLGMDTVADLLMIADSLAANGYSTEDVEAIMNGNWLRVLRGSLPQRQ
ncbi:MAG: membrane dipeptidase [Anaerolineae bacterium]|nr:membrane dipeptidase [Anaerolineae bacterium]